MSLVLAVCIPNSLRDYYDYQCSETAPEIGARVRVPFRKGDKVGIVVDIKHHADGNYELKEINEVLDTSPIIPESMLSLCQFIARYYQSPLSEVLALAIPKPYRDGECFKTPVERYATLCLPIEVALNQLSKAAKKQRALLERLNHNKTPVKQLQEEGFNLALLKSLSEKSLISFEEEPLLPKAATKTIQKMILNDEQLHAVQLMIKDLNQFHPFYLQGITGSGKTEVYLDVINEVLALNRQVLVLVPEIGLTPQLLHRFKSRINQPLAVIHSQLNEQERLNVWQFAADNHIKVVIGTRTAVFTPMPTLGLIVIDEEHDASFKQMDGVRYSARDAAIVRAKNANVPIILGSATPSLESLYNIKTNKFTQLKLTKRALNNRDLQFKLVDLRRQPIREGLCQESIDAIAKHLEQGEQVMVFINRRGYAPVLLCHQCSFMQDCPSCDAHLTYHQPKQKLICHHCGYQQKKPQYCAKCKSTELIAVGSGTQRVEALLQDQFPNVVIARIDRDEVSGKEALERELARITRGDVRIMIGTQMLAKGHHFPELGLVVILDADQGFFSQDFKALERLGQLLLQVAGRAGRDALKGKVLIQTHVPDNPLLNVLIQRGYDEFSEALLTMREQSAMPPFAALAIIRAKGTHIEQVSAFLKQVKQYLSQSPCQCFGPAPAPLSRKANQHRLQLLIKSNKKSELQKALTALRQHLSLNKTHQNIRWNIDVDPNDLT